MISPLIASDVDGGKESNIWREAKDFLEEDSEGVSGDFATKGDGFLEDSLEGGEDFLAAVLDNRESIFFLGTFCEENDDFLGENGILAG